MAPALPAAVYRRRSARIGLCRARTLCRDRRRRRHRRSLDCVDDRALPRRRGLARPPRAGRNHPRQAGPARGGRPGASLSAGRRRRCGQPARGAGKDPDGLSGPAHQRPGARGHRARRPEPDGDGGSALRRRTTGQGRHQRVHGRGVRRRGAGLRAVLLVDAVVLQGGGAEQLRGRLHVQGRVRRAAAPAPGLRRQGDELGLLGQPGHRRLGGLPAAHGAERAGVDRTAGSVRDAGATGGRPAAADGSAEHDACGRAAAPVRTAASARVRAAAARGTAGDAGERGAARGVRSSAGGCGQRERTGAGAVARDAAAAVVDATGGDGPVRRESSGHVAHSGGCGLRPLAGRERAGAGRSGLSAARRRRLLRGRPAAGRRAGRVVGLGRIQAGLAGTAGPACTSELGGSDLARAAADPARRASGDGRAVRGFVGRPCGRGLQRQRAGGLLQHGAGLYGAGVRGSAPGGGRRTDPRAGDRCRNGWDECDGAGPAGAVPGAGRGILLHGYFQGVPAPRGRPLPAAVSVPALPAAGC